MDKLLFIFVQWTVVMHQSFETPAPPYSGLSGGLRGVSPDMHQCVTLSNNKLFYKGSTMC